MHPERKRRDEADRGWALRLAAIGLAVGLVTGMLVITSGATQTSARVESRAAIPDGLFTDLVKIDRKLAKLIDAVPNELPGPLIRRMNEIANDKREMVNQYFGDSTYGVKFSVVFHELDCLDNRLGYATGRIAEDFAHFSEGKVIDAIKLGKKCKQRLEGELHAAQEEPPQMCTSTLERSPGGGNFTANNHIRVRALCDQPVTEIAVISLSGDTFNACAQTLGTATTCSASGDLLDTGWNAPANQQLEAYGRVTANADGNYRVRIRGAGAVVLHQYDATVPP